MIYPVKNPFISQKFGESPADYACWNLKGHNGIDLCTFWKDTIMAAHNGEVIKVIDDPYHTLGKNVWVYSEDYTTVYAHMENITVKLGDKVIQGQKIGEMGNTGNVRGATGIHLHFGVYQFVPAIPGTYQVNYNGKAYTILNHENGYGGALDPLLVLNTMEYITIGKEQYLLDNQLKIALNIGDEVELAKLRLQGLSGSPKSLSQLPEGYIIYPLVDKNRLKDIFGL